MAQNLIPIDVVHLLPVLDEQLLQLLKSLSPEDWQQPTIAKLWTVKDVAAHLLDGNIRLLSMLRDNYWGESAKVSTHQELVDYLNGLNADWVRAMRRVSPAMLIMLHELTGPLFCQYFQSLDPFGVSAFPVAWAGETESQNWMEIAREYTEKWLHQQQIRDALGRPGVMTRELFYPFINIFMLALPHTFREVDAPVGNVVQVTVSGEIGGSWHIVREAESWVLFDHRHPAPAAEVILAPDVTWKLFSKSWRPAQVRGEVEVSGDVVLGERVLEMVSVMA